MGGNRFKVLVRLSDRGRAVTGRKGGGDSCIFARDGGKGAKAVDLGLDRAAGQDERLVEFGAQLAKQQPVHRDKGQRGKDQRRQDRQDQGAPCHLAQPFAWPCAGWLIAHRRPCGKRSAWGQVAIRESPAFGIMGIAPILWRRRGRV